MGPISRYLGPEVPAEQLIWQDPVPAVDAATLIATQRRRRTQGHDPGLRCCPWPAGHAPRGRRPRRSAAPTSVAAPTERASAWPRRTAGTPTTRPSWPPCSRTLESDPAGVQRRQPAEHAGLAGRPHRARWAPLPSRRPPGRRVRGHRAVHPGPHRRDCRSRPTWTPSRSSSRPRTASATTSARATTGRAEQLLVDRAQLLTLTAPGDDRAGGRPAGPRRDRAPVHARGPHRPAGDADERLLRQPARPGHRVGADSTSRRTRSRAATGRPARSAGPAAASTWSSVRTRCCAPWPRSTPALTPAAKLVRDFVAAWDKVMMLDRFELA